MTAAQEFLVLVLMTGTAIARREVIADDETMMVDFLLTACWLVAVKTIHAFPGMDRHFIFVNDGILQARMTLGALARGTHKIRGRLLGFSFWPRPIDQKSRHNQRECNYDSNKD